MCNFLVTRNARLISNNTHTTSFGFQNFVLPTSKMHLARSLTAVALAARVIAYPSVDWNISAVDGSAADDLDDTMGDTIGKRVLLGGPVQTCPMDYPNECSCYGDGQLWCSSPETGNMADYDNNCEAKHHVRDIIYTLCTEDPEHPKDDFYSWQGKMVRPGENIYKCWPSKMIPPRSSTYQ